MPVVVDSKSSALSLIGLLMKMFRQRRRRLDMARPSRHDQMVTGMYVKIDCKFNLTVILIKIIKIL